jgi:hypothetical protein
LNLRKRIKSKKILSWMNYLNYKYPGLKIKYGSIDLAAENTESIAVSNYIYKYKNNKTYYIWHNAIGQSPTQY